MGNNNQDKGQPAMAWLHVPGYMIAWLEYAYGGTKVLYGHKLLSTWQVPGMRAALREHTLEDMLMNTTETLSLSAQRMDCLQAGMLIDTKAMEESFGMTKKALAQYVAIECPRLALTGEGVLRPWRRHIAFSRPQARNIQALLQREFWGAVAAYNTQYALTHEAYPAVEMVEAFCDETNTPEVFIAEIRREWQRKEKMRRDRGK